MPIIKMANGQQLDLEVVFKKGKRGPKRAHFLSTKELWQDCRFSK
jgi:hypothetical protein